MLSFSSIDKNHTQGSSMLTKFSFLNFVGGDLLSEIQFISFKLGLLPD